jgi:hypothetical protein
VLPGLRIASASAAAGWSDWALADIGLGGPDGCDPLIDRQQLSDSDRLTVFSAVVSPGGVGRIDTLECELS